jgi:hypothetical protein
MLSRTGPCPQSQAGKIGTRESSQIKVPEPRTGIPSALLNAWSCLWPRPPKNEYLLIAACHFWSNGVNAFLFGHGPMSPTLADVYMITGLDITGSVHPWDFKSSTRQTGVKPGSGYKNYIQNHMKDGPLGEVEYRAFLNMWLCRFIFCGKANEPTLNHIAMASHLANGNRLPLGKYLLGSVYHMLHQTVTQMYTS